MRTSGAALVVGLVLALSGGRGDAAVPAPPQAGELVPGTSLGGVRLGATAAQVERRWGRAYGVCRSCARETWYFNYYAFQPAGVGVELRNDRVVALFTVYSPPGWRTRGGVALGSSITDVTTQYGALRRQECGDYYALLLPRGDSVTVFYGLRDSLWAFALQRRGIPICR